MVQLRGLVVQLADVQQQLIERDGAIQRLREELEAARAALARVVRKGGACARSPPPQRGGASWACSREKSPSSPDRGAASAASTRCSSHARAPRWWSTTWAATGTAAAGAATGTTKCGGRSRQPAATAGQTTREAPS